MASIDSVKRALNSTTRMSLSERFQRLRQNVGNNNKVIQNTVSNRQALRQGSQKNRRLALQMANRPSVLAALRTSNTPKPQKTRSVKQRLGIKRNNNQLINANVNRNANQTYRKQNQRKPINKRNFNVNRNAVQNQNFVRTPIRRNNFVNTGVRPKVLNKGFRRGQTTLKNSPNVAKVGLRGKRKVGQQIRGNQVKTASNKKFRLNRNFNARNNNNNNRGKTGRGGAPNREQLDNDLDAYMAKTKSHLDSELDVYMSQTN
ncbi:chromatin target of PRMT1 protein-like [Oppia nitens]|uniref:chromatin target of PRMT1 protein-like n=1 Tax=Oppia nitens TaxID=1686743 RepID=UPI0023DA25FF|nr:chromatin target of PRMT1 protein-like [Oppia nitens]XP_054162799.1 chromatin target of PRMT1 protein-like [Oppia nitens]